MPLLAFLPRGGDNDSVPSPRSRSHRVADGDTQVTDQAHVADVDTTWITAMRADDETASRVAFEDLYQAHADGLIIFTSGYVESRAAAQDIVADLFIALWERRTTWNPTHGVRAYLYRAARNRARNAIRDSELRERLTTRAVHEPHIAGMGAAVVAADDALDIAHRVEVVARAIATFPEPRRRILELRWRDGLTATEIAHVLGVSRNSIDIHLSRSLNVLRRLLPELLD